MLKAICFNQEWFVPNVTALRTYSETVLEGKLYENPNEYASMGGSWGIYTSLHYDSTLKKDCALVSVRDCKMVDNKIWLSYDRHGDYGSSITIFYFKLDDVLADKNCELVMVGG